MGVAAPVAAGAAASGGAAAASTSLFANLALAASIASVGLGVFGAIRQGQAQEAQAKFQSRVSENNAKLAEQQAAEIRERGAAEEDEIRDRTARILSSQRANFAARGVVLETGTPLDVFESTAEAGELDALTLRANYERQATQREFEAQNLIAQGSLYEQSGEEARTSSLISAGGTLLSGTASTLSTASAFQEAGAPNFIFGGS